MNSSDLLKICPTKCLASSDQVLKGQIVVGGGGIQTLVLTERIVYASVLLMICLGRHFFKEKLTNRM
jgi:hypothetical protein